jgi:hypothetical protein
MSEELKNTRTLEKLEIERRYWAEQGVDWRIVTEREISRQTAKNIEWIYSAECFTLTDYKKYETERLHYELLNLLTHEGYNVIEATRFVERERSLPCGTGLQLFKQLVLDKKLCIDLSKPINLSEVAT